MNKIKENNNKTNKKKILISILFLALTLFTILVPLTASKTGDIKANAYTEPPTIKSLNLNGITYNYQTSLNELKNEYGFFKKWYYVDIFRITNNTEGETQLTFRNQQNGTLNQEEIERTTALLQQSFKFYIRDLNSDKVSELNNFVTYNTIDGNNETNNLVFDFDYINILTSLKNFSVNFSLLKQIPYYNDSVDDLTFNSFTMNFVYVNNNVNNNNLENIEYMDNNVKFFAYCFSNQVDYYNFELPILEDFTIRNIYLTFEEKDLTDENQIFQSIPSDYIFLNKEQWIDYGIVIDNIKFINNTQSNIISYNFDFDRNISEKTIYQGNILLSNTKFDEKLFDYLTRNISAENVIQPLGRGYFGGYNSEKNPQGNIYFKYLNSDIQGGVRYVACFDNINYNSPNYSLFTISNIGTEILKYNNQNQLLYLQDITDLKINSAVYTGNGLSAQVSDILYNVSLVGDINQIEQNDDIKEDFINLLKTSALGTFIGLIIGLISGAGPLGAIIGGSIGALVGVIPLIIDALQSLFGASPVLSTIYNLFKSVTMLFVDIFDAIINFALSFITNPIVLILVVVGILVYIFVIRKLKK